MARILIVGGYGAFGERLAQRLCRESDFEIIIAGRRAGIAEVAAAKLGANSTAKVGHAVIDAERVTPEQLRALAPAVTVNASGPFQKQDYRLARACIDAKCHYIDLADARDFVCGIGSLDTDAKAAGVAVISGASTVPGLSSAVVRHFAGDFAPLKSIDIGISPGNAFDPGLATTESILGSAGKPVEILLDGEPRYVRVWHGLHRHKFPEIGKRWLGYADVPDLDLFPLHYPGLKTSRVWAGAEVALFHLGIWALSGIVRIGLAGSLAPLARPLLGVKRRLHFLGTDRGGMFLTIEGTDRKGHEKYIEWHIIAKRGHGPYIPAIPSTLLAKRLARREIALTGAMPCFELFSLEDFMSEAADLEIAASCTKTRLPHPASARAQSFLP